MKYKVYLLENEVNHKTYIGVTKDLDRRFNEHVRISKRDNSDISKHYLHQAIEKYGWESFTHYIIQETDSLEFARSEERRYIKFFDAYESEYGYNLDKGGSGCDQIGGDGHYMVKASDEEVLEAMKDFMDNSKSVKDISEEFNMHHGSVGHIFSGKIRPYLQDKFKDKYGYEFQNKYRKKDNKIVRKALKLNKESNMSYRKISNILDVSDSTVYRWCTGKRRKNIYDEVMKE